MKRAIALCLILLLILTIISGCGQPIDQGNKASNKESEHNPNSPNTYLPQVLIDDVMFYLSGERPITTEIHESEYLGKITSVVPLSQIPFENGQANFNVEAGAPYAKYPPGIAVLWNGEWSLFVTEDMLRDESSSLPSGFPANAPEKAPQLEVVHTNGSSPEQRVQAIQLTTSWIFADNNGNGRGYEADSPHALQLPPNAFDEAKIRLVNERNRIEFFFSDDYLPESISVLRWNVDYARNDENDGLQNIDEALQKSEYVAVNSNSINVNNDGCDYIYEMHATWSNGNSYYTFRTESKDIEIINEDSRKPLPYSVGSVKAISNRTEYEPLVNWIYSLCEGIAADGAGLLVEGGELKDTLGNASGLLPYVQYSDDFRIVIDGESAGNPRYTLYNGEGELLYDSDSFFPPDSDGKYFLLVTLTWSNKDADKYLEYSGYQYWFYINLGK